MDEKTWKFEPLKMLQGGIEIGLLASGVSIPIIGIVVAVRYLFSWGC